MKKDHLFFVFTGMIIAMFIVFCSLVSNYTEAITKYDAAKAYIERLETDFPDYIDVSAESDEYYEFYN